MRLTILILVAAVNADAQTLNPKALDRVIDQLGADEFEQREAAGKTLAERARKEAEATRSVLKKRLLRERDPEIQFRVKQILNIISHLVPENVPFTEEGLTAKRWQILGDAPDEARYEFKEQVLEIYSLDKVEEGMAFVHRFRGRGFKGGPLKLFRGRPERDSEQFAMDAEIKILKEHHIRSGLAGMHLNVEDDRSSAALIILEDGIFLYRRKLIHKMDTTDRFHHFRFVIDGDLQKVFVDDMEKPIFELIRPTQAGRWCATFGDGTAGAGVHAEIRNATFSRRASDARKNMK